MVSLYDTKITKLIEGVIPLSYQEYDAAVSKVNRYLIENKYSPSVISSHMQCYRVFKQHLEEKEVPYSHQEGLTWLTINRPKWQHSKYKTFRISLFRLNDVAKNGCITTKKYVYENSCNYDRLADWCRILLDDFLCSLSYSYGEGYIRQHRIACSEFLVYISNIGGKKVRDITHKNIIDYYEQSEHSNLQAKNLYNRSIRHFLHYLSDRELIPASLAYTLDRFAIPKIIIIDELSDKEKIIWCSFQTRSVEVITATEFYAITKKLSASFLDDHHYSTTMKKMFRKAWRDFYIFLEANGLNYSSEIAEHWCVCLKKYTGQWKSYRRAFMLFEQFQTFGNIQPNIVYSYKGNSINLLPEWSRELLLAFLSKKQKEEISVSTINMYIHSCVRFLTFLDKKEIKCCDMIHPEIIKEFHISDPHSTSEARNAYSVRIRQFLAYLAELGYVTDTLPLALTTECARKTRVVEILTDEEIASVYRFRTTAEKPIELRDVAIVLLGLRMGLRASDITRMKLTAISWEEQTISVQQQKTNRFLKLPIPIDVANSLYKYIMEGRPKSDNDYVFITHRVPYGKLNEGCGHRALDKMLNECKKGFHITRRTFASRLLKSKTNTDTIANLLGHSDSGTVLKYLSTDENMMRQCALSLKGIEVKGGLLL